jgi:hypothetical protein
MRQDGALLRRTEQSRGSPFLGGMPEIPTLLHRSRLVGAANAVLPALWRTGAMTRWPLDVDAQLDRARHETGLDDFGDRWFLGPLTTLSRALREEAALNPLGRFAAVGQIIKLLRERLWTQHHLRENPGIAERPLARPVVVVGPMRSGTTRLHRLLAADTRFAHLRFFETVCPTPPPGFRPGGRDRRHVIAGRILSAVRLFNPNTAAIHPTAPFEAEEELGLLVASAWGMKHEAQWHIPSYGTWSEAQDATPAYEHMARLLRLVGWARGDDGARPWVLKTPQHMLDLPALLRVLPDARLIFIHRDPARVVGSSCSLAWNQMIIHSDEVDPGRVGREWLRKTELQIDRMRAAREDIPSEQCIDVRYEEMDRDWPGVMRRIYGFLDMNIAPALPAMERYLRASERQRSRRPHRYELMAFGLDVREVEARFDGYREAFGLNDPVRRPASRPARPHLRPVESGAVPAKAAARLRAAGS